MRNLPVTPRTEREKEGQRGQLTYVLITPARNEAAFIELTIKSVISQTVKPLKWIIVSDGSTDGTDEIVRKYAEEHDWIELLRMPERTERHFAGKVYAFNAGYERVKDLEFEVVGNLDADITFDEDYFEFLIKRFAEDDELGVAGTPFREDESMYDYRFTSIEHVSGACQLFRRECFEAIGGYKPIKEGGIDLAAVLTARMKGWKTRTFTAKTSVHHRKTHSGGHLSFKAIFKGGYHDYMMGGHPVWQFFRAAYQMTKKPVFISGLLLFMGYLWAMLIRAERPIPTQLIVFRREEQLRRLKDFIRKMVPSCVRGAQ
jgi:biofilm PGA synthesis N-glycosyltransferase PgaC